MASDTSAKWFINQDTFSGSFNTKAPKKTQCLPKHTEFF